MEQFELELIADEIERVILEKKDSLDRARVYIYEKFISYIRSQSEDDIDDFLEDFGS